MTLPTLPVSNVVNVQIAMSPVAAALRNFGATLIIGTSNVIDTATRIATYSSSELSSIARDFGADSPEYLACATFFGQSPQPQQVQIGRWAKTATSGMIKGRILSVSDQEMDKFTSINAGSFSVVVNTETVTATGVDLSAESNLNGVASQVTKALNNKATCKWTGERFLIIATATGADSKVSNVSSSELSGVMGLSTGTTMVTGADEETLTEAVNALMDFPTWYSAYVAADYTAEDALGASMAIEASNPKRIIAYTLTDTAELDSSQTSSLGYKLKSAQYNRTLTAYSSTNPHTAVSILGRMSTVDFAGSNTTLTLKFKQCPSVTPENLRTSQALALKGNNVNVFAVYDNDTSILQEGTMAGGWYIDERHGLDWLENYVQTAVWNLLYTSRKVGQDATGSTDLVATVSQAIEQGVTNGLIAPGVWNSDGFGAIKRGDTLSTGYYVYILPMDEQSQADREARKAPPIQCAVKLKGAVHFVDVTINVNR